MFKQFPIWSTVATVLLVAAIVIFAVAYFNATGSIPIAVSKVQRVYFSNYAGFTGKPNDAEDAQLISYGAVTITNTSANQKVALDLFLRITTKDEKNKTDLRLPADLQGPWGMIYGKDDLASKAFANRQAGEPPSYFRSPVELKPGETARKHLVFIFAYGADRRNAVLDIVTKDQNYHFDLEINDLITGQTVTIRIPGEYRGRN